MLSLLTVFFEWERVVYILAYNKKLLMSPADFARYYMTRAIKLLVLLKQQFVLAHSFIVADKCAIVWFEVGLCGEPAYHIVFVQMNIHDVALKDANVHRVLIASELPDGIRLHLLIHPSALIVPITDSPFFVRWVGASLEQVAIYPPNVFECLCSEFDFSHSSLDNSTACEDNKAQAVESFNVYILVGRGQI